ncbi:MAG: hypothetical protein C4336_08160 [Armatimonadota bacterium]
MSLHDNQGGYQREHINGRTANTTELVWPIDQCDYTTQGTLRVEGPIAQRTVNISVDFGAGGGCGRAKITSNNKSAIYEQGEFVVLSRSREQLGIRKPKIPRPWLARSQRS